MALIAPSDVMHCPTNSKSLLTPWRTPSTSIGTRSYRWSPHTAGADARLERCLPTCASSLRVVVNGRGRLLGRRHMGCLSEGQDQDVVRGGGRQHLGAPRRVLDRRIDREEAPGGLSQVGNRIRRQGNPNERIRRGLVNGRAVRELV